MLPQSPLHHVGDEESRISRGALRLIRQKALRCDRCDLGDTDSSTLGTFDLSYAGRLATCVARPLVPQSLRAFSELGKLCRAKSPKTLRTCTQTSLYHQLKASLFQRRLR